MIPRDDLLVWVDLEMTGLNPETCAIVEIAVIITDRDLTEVSPVLNLAVWQPNSVLETMDPYVRDMHKKTCLLDKIKLSKLSVADAELKALQMVSRYCSFQSAPLCGNAIGQDRRFLIKYMPGFERFLHYRNIDVSTVKELGYWWYKDKYVKPDEGKHTALQDIKQSIAELAYLREKIFQNPMTR